MQTLVPYMSLVDQFEKAPPGKLYCVHGQTGGVFRLSLSLASHALVRGVPIAVVDGTNRFDAYYIAEFARGVARRQTAGPRITPDMLLRRIHVARAFTCYQMEATITDRLPAFLERMHAPVAVVFGLLDTFYDEQAPLFEVRASLERILAALERLKQANISVLLASRDTVLASRERNALFPRLLRRMDAVFTLEETEDGPRLLLDAHRKAERGDGNTHSRGG
jgi:hypothetical protein